MRAPSRTTVAVASGLALSLAVALPVRAATITIQSVDSPNEGFNDPTAATPVGGNMGTTVGEQRMNVFKKVAQLWGDALESVPTIVVSASFAPLTCNANQIMLGQAAYVTSQANTPNAPPNVWIPIALANALAGTDLSPDEEEIDAMFNGGLTSCSMGLQNWYYGLDGMAGDDIDLLAVVLHEFGHGLGFASVIDPSTGDTGSNVNWVDLFAQNVYDNGTNKAWSDTTMTAAERATSAMNARHLVWTGTNVQRQMAQILALGSPTMGATPTLSGLTGHVTESEFGPYLSMKPVSGPLKIGKLTSTCSVNGSVTGGIVAFAASATTMCPPVQAAFMAQQAGAIGAMFEDPVGADPPYAVSVLPSIADYGPVTIPAVSLSTHDMNLFSSAGSSGPTIALGAVANQHVGADEMGRTYLYASNPVAEASTLSHWDPLARPDLLMEPQIASKATHDQRMELAAFRDMGWHTVCGNGTMDAGEQCDQGAQNGAPGATCNPDCTMATGTIGGSGGTTATGSGGTTGTGSGGSAASGTGGASAMTGTGGAIGSGGTVGSGGQGSGGSVGLGSGGTRTGGTMGVATGGTSSASGGAPGSGGATASGGAPTGTTSSGGTGPQETGGGSKGCSCDATSGAGSSSGVSLLMFAGLAVVRRRRRP